MRKLLFVLVIGLALSVTTSMAVQARGFNSQLNHTNYWGNNCVKFENFNNQYRYSSSNDDTTKVVIKAGTKIATYDEGNFQNLSSPINDRNGKPYAISHVIECYDQKTVVEEPQEDPKDDNKVYVCHWTEGINEYILVKVSYSGAENGHLGDHHHHDKDYISNGDDCYQQDDVEDPDDPVQPDDPEDEPEDDPEVLGETDGKGGGEEILAETGVGTALAVVSALSTSGIALAAASLSKTRLEDVAI